MAAASRHPQNKHWCIHQRRNTPESTRAPPIWSDNHPPTGRRSVATATNPAVRNPASAGVSPNSSRRSVGKYMAKATNPPKVRK